MIGTTEPAEGLAWRRRRRRKRRGSLGDRPMVVQWSVHHRTSTPDSPQYRLSFVPNPIREIDFAAAIGYSKQRPDCHIFLFNPAQLGHNGEVQSWPFGDGNETSTRSSCEKERAFNETHDSHLRKKRVRDNQDRRGNGLSYWRTDISHRRMRKGRNNSDTGW